jgi:leucyl/phenylalanyl-tRNA--protein transferase
MYFYLTNELYFPPVHKADSQGILAIGGDLSVERILLAYRSGIFPWYSEDDPILWWSPNPRFVLFPDKLKVAKSMRPIFNSGKFKVTFDTQFREVITNCKNIFRPDQNGTWLNENMLESFCKIHELGLAHSVEVWQKDELVGGLYGISLGNCFFGESMFAKVSNASKVGFITLVRKLQEKGFEMIDCQVHTKHLESLGAEHIMRNEFMKRLQKCLEKPNLEGKWTDL